LSTSIAILTKHITTYHHARYTAAAKQFENCDVLDLTGDSDFPELLTNSKVAGYVHHWLFRGRSAYQSAVASGDLSRVLIAMLNEIHPMAIAVSGWSSPESFIAIAWARKEDARVILLSESQETDSERDVIREFVKQLVVRLFDTALVGGKTHAEYLHRLGMSRGNIEFGYDVVDNAHFSRGAGLARADELRVRQRLNLPRCYILASGRFIPKKNFARLIEAYLRIENPVGCLVIIGDGGEREALEEIIYEKGAEDRVYLPGFVGYDDLPAVYGLSLAFVHVPLHEQWGLVVNEAAASGVPLIISSNCGAGAELLEPDVNGYRVDAESIDEISQALSDVMTLDSAARIQMARRSREVVADWGPERYAAGLRSAYDKAKEAPQARLRLLDRVLIWYLGKREQLQVS
jgi:glycosyltransferase involved in cell wall biosynthesis